MNYKRYFIPNGLIFLTIVANKIIPILIDNIEILKNSFLNVTKFYKFDLVAYLIQPDPIQCIIKLTSTKKGK